MNQEELTTVTYNFADGTKVSQPINDASFWTEKGKRRDADQMQELFQQTAHDKGAISYTLNHINDSVPVVEREKASTRAEVKSAVRDYKEMKKMNPEGFMKEKNHFQAVSIDTKKKAKRQFTIGWSAKLRIV